MQSHKKYFRLLKKIIKLPFLLVTQPKATFNKIKNYFKIIILLILTRKYKKKPVVVFQMDSLGERQFFEPTLKALSMRIKTILVISHNGIYKKEIMLVNEDGIKVIYLNSRLFSLIKKRISLFLNTEFSGHEGVLSVLLFHGQPSKGVTFPYYKVWEHFDAMFLLGPLQREAYEEAVIKHTGKIPSKPLTFNIGYPKSDDLINNKYNRESFLLNLNLDEKKKTIIYAPAFNEGSSLRCFGLEIIETLCQLEYNVLAKLPIDCLQPTTDYYATGGIDWFKEISLFQSKYNNFKLITDLKIDHALAASDVMVSCISSVGFEFMAIGKPVIFFNTPKYFSEYLKKLLPDEDMEIFSRKNHVNGGKEWGLVINTPNELPDAIDEVIKHPELYPKDPEKLRSYLVYNPGKAAETAVDTIISLIKHGGGGGVTLIDKSVNYFNKILPKYGYIITKTGLGFLNAKDTYQKAKNIGKSIGDYLEMEDAKRNVRHFGRRDRIINKIIENVSYIDGLRVLEIGPGTGRYMEKILQHYPNCNYEIYETASDWVSYLNDMYAKKYKLCIHPADGSKLSATETASCDIVHAHAVFVYLPCAVILSYLNEMVRVLKKDGVIIFDILSSSDFDINNLESFIDAGYLFPVIFPNSIFEQWMSLNNLILIEQFNEIYGPYHSNYYIFKRC
jgi:CDP-glycerol glycerophosphotransferase (TagB/SpsB family)/ubiquinone/menaquinone biosynthesis C-methylase UbiE